MCVYSEYDGMNMRGWEMVCVRRGRWDVYEGGIVACEGVGVAGV